VKLPGFPFVQELRNREQRIPARHRFRDFPFCCGQIDFFLSIRSLLPLMKKMGALLFLIILVFSSGCSSYFSNLTTPQKNLALTESAVFSQEKTNFVATVSRIDLNQRVSFPRQVTVTLGIKNSGKDAFSLIAYPRLVDAAGREYPGTNIVYGAIQAGGSSTMKSSMVVKSEEEYAALQKNAVLKVRFQSMKPLPYEAIWDIDMTKI
jgi:hypothetical protein